MSDAKKKAEPPAACQVPDEMKDRHASQLRSEGMSYREIARDMSCDVSMAHRRVRRGMEQRRRGQQQEILSIRQQELVKLDRLEKVIIADAYHGNLTEFRLVLRIMSMRLRLLKEISLDTAAQTAEEPGDQQEAQADRFLHILKAASSQAESANDVASNDEGSTEASTPEGAAHDALPPSALEPRTLGGVSCSSTPGVRGQEAGVDSSAEVQSNVFSTLIESEMPQPESAKDVATNSQGSTPQGHRIKMSAKQELF